MAKFDHWVVYYWFGGKEYGEWRATLGFRDRRDASTARVASERSGYVSKLGRTSIGPPEGPPSPSELDYVWRRR